MGERSLILVPTHPGHFHWARQLLDSATEAENICLGFSNEADARTFSHPFPYRVCIIDPIVDEHNGTFTFINRKKFNLLRKLQHDYDYIACIDDEAVFLRPMTPHLKDLWDANSFLASHSIDGKKIMDTCYRLCGYESPDDLYPWFNSPPIYKTDSLPGFFTWLDARDPEVHNCGVAFDFLLYSIYWRMELKLPWRVLGPNVTKWHGLVEHPEWHRHTDLHNQVAWSTYFPGVENHENIKMLFHLDRYPRR